jgi:hypothetical protein
MRSRYKLSYGDDKNGKMFVALSALNLIFSGYYFRENLIINLINEAAAACIHVLFLINELNRRVVDIC